MPNDNFDPEMAEAFAKLIGLWSKNAENLYRLAINCRESNPALSNIYMLGFFGVVGHKLLK